MGAGDAWMGTRRQRASSQHSAHSSVGRSASVSRSADRLASRGTKAAARATRHSAAGSARSSRRGEPHPPPPPPPPPASLGPCAASTPAAAGLCSPLVARLRGTAGLGAAAPSPSSSSPSRAPSPAAIGLRSASALASVEITSTSTSTSTSTTTSTSSALAPPCSTGPTVAGGSASVHTSAGATQLVAALSDQCSDDTHACASVASAACSCSMAPPDTMQNWQGGPGWRISELESRRSTREGWTSTASEAQAWVPPDTIRMASAGKAGSLVFRWTVSRSP